MSFSSHPQMVIEPGFPLQVARGKVKNWFAATIVGENPNINSTTYESIWNAGGIYTGWDVTSAAVVTIVSDNVNDAAAGTGARTVLVEGLDGDYNEISETVTLDGTSIVTTSATFLRVWRVTVQTAGSGEANAGVISGTIDGDSVFVMPAGNNRTLLSMFTVPANAKAYLYHFWFENASNDQLRWELNYREENGVFVPKRQGVIHRFSIRFNAHGIESFTEKTDIDIRSRRETGAGTSRVTSGYRLLIERNSV